MEGALWLVASFHSDLFLWVMCSFEGARGMSEGGGGGWGEVKAPKRKGKGERRAQMGCGEGCQFYMGKSLRIWGWGAMGGI